MNIKHKITIIGYTSWCGLGFIRGINSYKYNHEKYDEDKPYLYLSSIGNGLFGIVMYGNPILLPICIHKELYRLEVNIRNLEDEKKNTFYNDIF
jgi:hypothetical protein